MGKRVESPSSINTFLQCNRKYYYQYIEALPTKPSIYTIRGNIVHEVLEAFYVLDPQLLTENYEKEFQRTLQRLFLEHWGKHREELRNLELPEEEIAFYFEETLLMLHNWLTHFLDDFAEKRSLYPSLAHAFQALRPLTEVAIVSDQYSVQGHIDAIRDTGNEVQIIDYKTNATVDIKESMWLQLGIYSLLYQEKYGRIPEKIGIFFLRDKLQLFPVEPRLLEKVKETIAQVHGHTSKTEAIQDYQRKVGPLCKWKNGQCDFYDTCKPFG